jgi:hypothetical protein
MRDRDPRTGSMSEQGCYRLLFRPTFRWFVVLQGLLHRILPLPLDFQNVRFETVLCTASEEP